MSTISIARRVIGAGHPAFVIAEVSANHHGRKEEALRLIELSAEAGADAVKLQTYTADTMTIAADTSMFRIGDGTVWAGRNLYDLYQEAATPWDWYADLAAAAEDHGMVLFSTPFDRSAVEFLVAAGAPALKIASFELTDLPLLKCAASTGLPIVLSTGMATVDEIDEAVATVRAGGCELALLRCNSAYPASPAEMDLRTIPDMLERWGVPVGLSDHTMGIAAVVAAIALGASIIEKHVTMSRSTPGPDSAFSLEPDELAQMVAAVREAEATLGSVRYGPTESEKPSLAFRRSIFVVADVRAGEPFTESNVRVIRPAGGLEPKRLDSVLGRRAARDLTRGTPLTEDALAP